MRNLNLGVLTSVMLMTSGAYAATICDWIGQDPGAQLVNIDQKSETCAKYSDKLPSQLCTGVALCHMERLEGFMDPNEPLNPTKTQMKELEIKRRIAVVKAGLPSTMAAGGLAAVICEPSAPGKCPSADDCIYHKWQAGNPTRLAKGEAVSDLDEKSLRLKNLDRHNVSEKDKQGKLVNGIFHDVSSLDEIKTSGSEQGVTVMLVENKKGVLGKDGFISDNKWKGAGWGPSVCLSQFAKSIADCNKDGCVTFAEAGGMKAPTLNYAKINSPGSSREKKDVKGNVNDVRTGN